MERTSIRYQTNEHVAHAIARALRRRSIDIATAADFGTVGLPDDELLARCLAESRVLVTPDRDFLRLRQRGVPHVGIVFGEQGSRSVVAIVAHLLLITDVLSPGEMAGRVEFL